MNLKLYKTAILFLQHPQAIEAIHTVLSKRKWVKVKGIFTDPNNCWQTLEKERPDVFFFDYYTPQSYPMVNRIVATMPHTKNIAVSILWAGAKTSLLGMNGVAGYVYTEMEPDDMLDIFDQIMRGERVFAGQRFKNI